MMSGTSMAAPHVAGLAALIKMKFPSFSPAAIGSALSTTASLNDKNGQLMMAQRAYSNPDLNQSPATPFDMGSGFVNATAALNPGLIFDVGKLFQSYKHPCQCTIMVINLNNLLRVHHANTLKYLDTCAEMEILHIISYIVFKAFLGSGG